MVDKRGAGKGALASRQLGACIFDYIDRIRILNDPKLVIEEMARQLADFGIEYYGFARQSGCTEAFRRGIVVDKTHRQWSRYFFESGHGEGNPSTSGVLNGEGPLFWSELVKLPKYGKRLSAVSNDAKAFGIEEGLNIPIVRPKRFVAFATFYGRDVDTSPGARVAMHAIALYTHDRLVRLGAARPAQSTKLTPREADCLAWVAQGKTDWEIGEILGISENTVHWYVERAKRRLNVATRIQAVVGAIQEGVIDV